MVGFAWDLGIPVGSVHDFTSNVSGLGFDISFRYWLHPQITIGGEVEWQTYNDEKPRSTYQLTNGALTATAYNTAQLASLRLNADYYFVDRGPVLPFAGVNIGYGWSTFQAAAADIALYDNQDSVVLGAELGALFALSPRSPLVLVAGRYSAAPSMEFLNSVKDVQQITFQLGLLLY
jgi:opacity protein-like surface antigen